MQFVAIWFLIAAIQGSAAVTTHVSVWPVDSLVKVFPDDPAGANRANESKWLVPRNGHATIQFVVRANTEIPALRVRVTSAGGLTTLVRRVGFVPVHNNTENTPVDELVRRAPGRFPDPLLEGDHFALPAHETTAFWVTVYAPTETKPGEYQGEAVFQADRNELATMKFPIQVAEATVPSKQTLKVSHWFYFDEQTMAPYFDVINQPEKLWALLGNIARMMGEHKQNVFLTPVLALTDAKINGGKLEYDFSRLDRFVNTVTGAGAMELIEGSHLIERAGGYDGQLKVPGFVINAGEVKRLQIDPDDPRALAHLNSFLPALYAHLKKRKWVQRYVQHVLDEPHGKEPSVYLQYVPIIRRNLPGIRTIDAFDQEDRGWLGDACDIEVLQLGKFDRQMDAVREHVRAGGQAWYYTSLLPQGRYLNRFIDFPLLKTRLLPWLDYRYGLSGYLQWGGDSWGANPFEITELGLDVGAPTKGALPPGDAFITYPWREENSIHSSIRLEAMREGIEEYELLRALAVKDPARAMRLARQAIPDFTGYVRSVRAFREIQAELLAAQ